MDNPEQKTFHCDLIDPMGKLLDCRTTAVILPAHDGQIGILYNHSPLLCELGLGIMKVTVVSEDQYQGPFEGDALFFIDGGFALVASNSVMVVAYNAVALKDLKPEKVELMIERTTRILPGATLSADQRTYENERLRLLRHIAESLGN